MRRIITLLSLLFFTILVNAQSVRTVSPKQFYSLTQKHPEALLIDVRQTDKFLQYRIAEATPLPTKAQLITYFKEVSREDTVFVYCEIEKRSPVACATLDSLGFKHVYELKGGLMRWRRNGLPVDENNL